MKYLRIKKNKEFQRIFEKGKRGFSAHLTILYLPSEQMKMGICVSKKHGKSVQRNRVKRLIREIFRLHHEEMKENYSYVILPKVAEEYDYKTLEKEFLYIIKRKKLRKEENNKGKEMV